MKDKLKLVSLYDIIGTYLKEHDSSLDRIKYVTYNGIEYDTERIEIIFKTLKNDYYIDSVPGDFSVTTDIYSFDRVSLINFVLSENSNKFVAKLPVGLESLSYYTKSKEDSYDDSNPKYIEKYTSLSEATIYPALYVDDIPSKLGKYKCLVSFA